MAYFEKKGENMQKTMKGWYVQPTTQAGAVGLRASNGDLSVSVEKMESDEALRLHITRNTMSEDCFGAAEIFDVLNAVAELTLRVFGPEKPK